MSEVDEDVVLALVFNIYPGDELQTRQRARLLAAAQETACTRRYLHEEDTGDD